MAFPVAHGLLGATVVVALSAPSQPHRWKLVISGAALAISPDLDYALNLMGISGGGWHHGFTHSMVFAFILAAAVALTIRPREVRTFILLALATASHTLLDFIMTESRGVALCWPFTDKRFKLRLNNPIDYTLSYTSVWEMALSVVRISLVELLLFGIPLLAVVLAKRFLFQRDTAAQSEI